MDIVSDSRIRLFGNAPRRSCQRFAALFRSTWDHLPIKDRRKMLAYCRRVMGRNVSPLLYVHYESDSFGNTCAFILPKKCEIWFERRAMRASTDARVKAIIAHELGHLRSYCDPNIEEYDDDQHEAEANRYAELWGYPCVEVLYKTKECDGLQQFSRQFGMRWRIFYFQGFHEKHFTCLKPGERILGIDKF